MNFFYQILFVLITTGFFVAGNTITAHWARTNQQWLWIPIVLCAAIGYMLFGLLIRQTNFSVSVGLVDALLVVISIAIGVFILKDTVNIQQMIGLAFACLAVILLV